VAARSSPARASSFETIARTLDGRFRNVIEHPDCVNAKPILRL